MKEVSGSEVPPVLIGYEDLKGLLQTILVRAGASDTVASILAANCAGCERDGCHSHGVFRIPGYVRSMAAGWVDGRAVPVASEVGPSFLRIDARNGFAQPAAAFFENEIRTMVRETGVAVVAIRDSHHFSALWPDLEPFALEGFVGLTMVTGGCVVVPPEGKARVLGTNPIAFATPVAGDKPMIFDFATSAMSHGDLQLAAAAGKPVPLGTGVDAEGALTQDPAVIQEGGGILPFGGHKGAALSLMVEILASGLTGGQFSAEVDFSGFPGAETPCTGQLMVLLDPDRGGDRMFGERIGSFLDKLRLAGQQRFPSERRYRSRAVAERAGISISRDRFRELEGLAIEPC